MADVFLAEIRAVAFNFAPRGWATCSGQLMPISQNTALFSLLGTQFGGDGKSTFALPDLRSRVAIGQGSGVGLTPYFVGEDGGEEGVGLSEAQLPAHSHSFAASNSIATSSNPTTGTFALPAVNPRMRNMYGYGSTALADGSAIGGAGSDAPHDNIQPYQGLLYIIALQGIFPARN